MIAEALMNTGGVYRANKVIKMIPDQSVTKLQFGDPIALTADQFEDLAAAFFDEIQRRFL
jgi:hypothetical protein